MQQFVVPQFIDNEDKILGPITVRQFLIVLVAVIICAVFYKLLDFTGFVLGVFLVGGLAAVLAFVKMNGRPFHYFLLNLLQLALRPNVRIWKQSDFKKIEQKSEAKKPSNNIPQVVKPKQIVTQRLSELSLLVDTGGQYRPEEEVFNK